MEFEKKYYKLKLCDFYEKYGKCTKGHKCSYAHGKEELREFKKECVNSLYCFKDNCHFTHPEGWNPKNNKKICGFYKNGFCRNGDNCEFSHIKEENVESIEINKQENKVININGNNEFPSLVENKTNIVESNNDCMLEDNKNQDKDINVNNDLFPNIEIFLDGVKYNNENIINEKINNNIEIQEIIINLQNSFERYAKEIKNNIDEMFIDDKYNYGINMKIELNKIMSEIKLFKNNYHDIFTINK